MTRTIYEIRDVATGELLHRHRDAYRCAERVNGMTRRAARLGQPHDVRITGRNGQDLGLRAMHHLLRWMHAPQHRIARLDGDYVGMETCPTGGSADARLLDLLEAGTPAVEIGTHERGFVVLGGAPDGDPQGECIPIGRGYGLDDVDEARRGRLEPVVAFFDERGATLIDLDAVMAESAPYPRGARWPGVGAHAE